MNNSASVTVRKASADDFSAWNKYLNSHQDANFYQRFEWKNIIENNFGHECYFLMAEENNSTVGLFPIAYVKSKLFGKILSAMPYVNFGGICSDSEVVNEVLLSNARQLTIDSDADYLEIRSISPISDTLPTSLHKLSMTLDLDPDPDIIWNGFKSKHRTNIRSIYKKQIHVVQGRHELLDTFYEVMAESWRALGTPIYKKSFFKNILDTFPEETKIFVAYQYNRPVATAFNGYYNNIVEGMWAGSIPGTRKIQPNYVLYWEMIKDACEMQLLHYHLGRSSSGSGAEDFKKKWNAYPSQLYWHYILNNSDDIPQLNVNNPKYELAIKAWKKLPLIVTKVIGPHIAKSIP